jgi:RND family efflux transporter MFP subunit
MIFNISSIVTRIMFACAPAALLATLLVACSDSSEPAALIAPSNNTPSVVLVRTALVEERQFNELLYFAAIARARQRASLSFQVGGTVQARRAQIGQAIVKGEVVATLYNPQLKPAAEAAEARLQQLRVDFDQAERDLVRFEEIHDQGLLSIQNVEQQRTLVRSTLSAIDNAKAVAVQTSQLNKERELLAPFAGRIEAILLEPGEFAQPGQAVMRMAADDGIEVEVRVPPHILGVMQVGQEMPVRDSLTGKTYVGVVSEVGETSSGENGLYPLVVSMEGQNLKGGESLEVGIKRITDAQISIPIGAVMRSAAGLTVFKVARGIAQRTKVEVAHITGGRAVLVAGSLNIADEVVYAGLSRLADGDNIGILP